MAVTLPAEEDGQRGSWGRGDVSQGHGPPEGGSGNAAAVAGTPGYGSPTDADVVAEKQGPGGACQCEAPGEWCGNAEDRVCAGDRKGRGVQRRKRERRRVQHLKEHRGGRHSSGFDAPMEGRRRTGVCRHPGGAKGEWCSVTRESHYETWSRHTVVWRSGSAPGRCYDTMALDSGQTKRHAAVSAGVQTSGVERQLNGAKAWQTSLAGGMRATRRPKRVRRRCCRAQQ